MEQAVMSATSHQASFSRAFQMTPPETELDTMHVGDIELNLARRTVRKSGHRVHLYTERVRVSSTADEPRGSTN
jgi:hypothetical protein